MPTCLMLFVCCMQDGGKAVGMALAEPLGGGMFASNVVFGMVVLIASKQQVRGTAVGVLAAVVQLHGQLYAACHSFWTTR